jgi:hypothetical protein
MEAGSICEHFFKLLSPTTTAKSMHYTYFSSACKFASAQQKSSLHVPESSNDYSDGIVECCHAEAFGDDMM